MQTRFVAVLTGASQGTIDSVVTYQTLEQTISHELVHAYLNSRIGLQNENRFPVWFHEGMAIYISGGSGSRTVDAQGVEVQVGPTEDYKQYGMNFGYLESKLGRGRFLELLKDSVNQLDPMVPLRAANVGDYAALTALARDWQQKTIDETNFHRDAAKLSLSAVLALSLALFFWSGRARPAAEVERWTSDMYQTRRVPAIPAHIQAPTTPMFTEEPTGNQAPSAIDVELAELGIQSSYGRSDPLHPGSIVTWYRWEIGLSYRAVKEERWLDAISGLAQLIESDELHSSPGYALVLAAAHYVRGLAFQGKGDHANARADYRAAISILPTYELAIHAMDRVRSPLNSEKNYEPRREKEMASTGKATIYKEFLEGEGYRPTVAPEGNFVFFKHEGGTYCLDVDDKDEQYFRLVYPNFWEIGEASDLSHALSAANQVTTLTKAAKVCVRDDGKQVTASIELFFERPDQFKPVFNRSIVALKAAVNTFVEKMKK
ncbi:MAG: hypothetical protein M1570_01275 [Chloroflexi bacterium]|nr:hypothetical protein [Chloroflexota bacterium]